MSGASSEADSKEGKHKKSEKNEKDHRGSLVMAPLPMGSPALRGMGLVLVMAYIFPFSENDKVSPPSTVAAAGLFTKNGTRGVGGGTQLFLKETGMSSQAVLRAAH